MTKDKQSTERLKKERLAAALRANLKKRKQQQRTREQSETKRVGQ